MIPLRDNVPTRRFPVITLILIALNVVVFLSQVLLGPQAAARHASLYGLIPWEITHGVARVPHPVPLYGTLLTSMFVHGGLLHIAGNMLYLWIFGNNVEDAMGRARFLVFYFLCGVGGALAHWMVNPLSTIPMVGASGAVSGVLGAYLFLHPSARILTLVIFGWFIRVLEIPAGVVLGFWIVVQLVNGWVTFGGQSGGVAWFAHMGGLAAGLVCLPFFKRRSVPWGFRRRAG
jgi:membrane associated rhomboid family serine protease